MGKFKNMQIDAKNGEVMTKKELNDKELLLSRFVRDVHHDKSERTYHVYPLRNAKPTRYLMHELADAINVVLEAFDNAREAFAESEQQPMGNVTNYEKMWNQLSAEFEEWESNLIDQLDLSGGDSHLKIRFRAVEGARQLMNIVEDQVRDSSENDDQLTNLDRDSITFSLKNHRGRIDKLSQRVDHITQNVPFNTATELRAIKDRIEKLEAFTEKYKDLDAYGEAVNHMHYALVRRVEKLEAEANDDDS